MSLRVGEGHGQGSGHVRIGTGFQNWMEYELENHRRQAALGGSDPAEIEESLRNLRLFTALFYPLQWPLERIQAEYPQFRENWPDGVHMYAGKHYRYFQQIHELNLARLWQDAEIHALAIWGTSDFVSGADDHARIAEAVNHTRPGWGTYLPLSQTDHWLNTKASMAESLEQAGQGEFNTAFIEVIDEWMRGVLRGGAGRMGE